MLINPGGSGKSNPSQAVYAIWFSPLHHIGFSLTPGASQPSRRSFPKSVESPANSALARDEPLLAEVGTRLEMIFYRKGEKS
jgi:hypothetical protein